MWIKSKTASGLDILINTDHVTHLLPQANGGCLVVLCNKTQTEIITSSERLEHILGTTDTEDSA